jgi:Fe-S oxidoreductase
VLWPDTFSDLFSPARISATSEVLRLAGERVAIPAKWACCGRTLYDSGMLDTAKASARRVLDVLGPFLDRDLPVVVVEPSCLATFRDEFPQLLADDPRAARLAALSRSLAEHLDVTGWVPAQSAAGAAVSVHPHCHERATGGSGSTLTVLRRAGFDAELLDLGCCGLAGSFGYEKSHDALSRQIAADRFVPGLSAAAATRRLVIDGFSCDLQATQLTSLAHTTLAQLLLEHATRRTTPPT